MSNVDLSRYDDFFLDCDGVIWEGTKAISGSVATLQRLEALGKRVFFVTNNSTHTQEDVARKALQLGYSCRPDHVFSSGKATGLYLLKKHPSVHKLYLIGQPAFRKELQKLGFTVVHKDDFTEQNIFSLEQLKSLRPEPGIQAVVVGYQLPFNYLSAYYASMCVQSGALLIASNPDRYMSLREGIRMPGNGVFVAFLESATDHKAEIVGKPGPFFLEWAQDQYQVDSRRCLMIGDSLETDIAFAKATGMDSLLVLSGVTTQSSLFSSEIQPTYVLPQLSSLIP